jgi:hypothetical protein
MPRTAAALLLALAAAAPAAAEPITTPSGLEVTLFDVVLEPDAGLARFRFVAPPLSGLAFDAVQGDFPWLCANVALPALAANSRTVAQVIVSVSDRELPLGVTDPDAVQYFEGFRIEDAACLWEPY